MHQWSRIFITSSTFGTGRPVSAARASFMASLRMSLTLYSGPKIFRTVAPSRTMSLPVRSCRTSSPAAGAFLAGLAGLAALGALVTLATLAAALSVEDFFMVV